MTRAINTKLHRHTVHGSYSSLTLKYVVIKRADGKYVERTVWVFYVISLLQWAH